MDLVKKIVQWVLTAALVFLAVIWLPSISSVIFLVGAIVVLPIKPLDEFLEKHKINFAVRIVAAIILFVIGIAIAPGSDSTSLDNPKDNKASVSEDKDKDKDKDKNKDKDKDKDKDKPKDSSNQDTGKDKDTDKPDNPTDTPDDDPDEPADNPDDDPDEPAEPDDGPDVSEGVIEDFYHGEVPPNPVFVVEKFGNFKDYDKSVFETAQGFTAKDLVGRWYEDGLLEGYCLELYGNGTWKYFGPVERNGIYQISYGLIVLTESVYGVDVCQPSVFFDDDDNAWEMSLTPTGPEVLETHRDSDDYVLFVREDGCKHCDNLEAFYEKKYPYKDLAGDWYPVGDRSGKQYYNITANAHWSYISGHMALEVGVLESAGKGKFTSEGGTWGEISTFETGDDGYLYINGEPYEKVEGGAAPPNRSLGTFCYENGDGYTFYEDWSFESLPNSTFSESGTFMMIGSDVLLYDEDGNRIHVFYQDEFMDWDGEWKEEASRRRMENRDDSELYGELIYYQLPDED